ncbi:MAG: alpha/beta hydrolase [Saccharofermentanales bacterium]
MNRIKYPLWTEDDMVTRSGSGKGTFLSGKPSMEFFPADGDGVPGQADRRGCVIVCPGGGYGSKTMDYEGEEIAEFLNRHGIHAFVLDYRLSPDHHPAPLNDALRAIEMAKKLSGELGYLSDKIGIMGFSAGGHLAASAGTMWTGEANRPDAMVLCYPVITMGKLTHIGSRSNLLGENINEASIGDMSCENRVDKQTPPAFIWHTADDEGVPVANALLFANALTAKSIPFELHIYPHGRHGLGLAHDEPAVGTWSSLCISWLNRLGF